MGGFLDAYGEAIVIALVLLAILAYAEYRDHRDGLYDDDETRDLEHTIW